MALQAPNVSAPDVLAGCVERGNLSLEVVAYNVSCANGSVVPRTVVRGRGKTTSSSSTTPSRVSSVSQAEVQLASKCLHQAKDNIWTQTDDTLLILIKIQNLRLENIYFLLLLNKNKFRADVSCRPLGRYGFI